jgi:hypothetical protein
MGAICNAKHASPQKQVNSNRMTKQQLIEKVAAKTEASAQAGASAGVLYGAGARR